MGNAILSLILTWGIGLVPALLARYVWKKSPLASRTAYLIAGTSCIILAVLFAAIRSLNGGDDGISLAWILVFIVSVGIMRHGHRAQLIGKLQAIADDPNATEKRRAYAQNALAKLKKKPRIGQ